MLIPTPPPLLLHRRTLVKGREVFKPLSPLCTKVIKGDGELLNPLPPLKGKGGEGGFHDHPLVKGAHQSEKTWPHLGDALGHSLTLIYYNLPLLLMFVSIWAKKQRPMT